MAGGRFRFSSLRGRLLMLVALAIAPMMVMSVLSGLNERRQAIRQAHEYLQRLTNLAAANEAQSMERGRQLLQDLASAPDLLGDQAACRALMATLLRNHNEYNNFGLIQLNGDVTCSAVGSDRMVNLADRPHFQRAVIDRGFFASDYVFGRLTQDHTVNLSYPVLNARKEVVAVVYAALDLASLDRFVQDIALPPGSVMLTADRQGNIISRRPDPLPWIGKAVAAPMRAAMAGQGRALVLLTGADGVVRLHTFARVGVGELTGYTISIGIARDGIVAAAQRNMLISLLGLAFTGALALAVAWLVGEALIVDRIRTLSGQAERIAGAGPEADNPDDLDRLARALDQVALTLQAKDSDYRVAERQMRVADQRKDEFVAMLAHELRNPLAPISTGAQLLRLACHDQPAVARTAEMIARQVEHMTQLVEDLLDVSRVTRGLVTLSREPLDLNHVVAAAAEQAAALFAQRRQRLSVHLPGSPAGVAGDDRRLVQVVGKLLHNAAQYTPEGGQVSMTLELDSVRALWQLGVADDGIGMAPEVVVRVFDLFSRAERTPERAQGGMGLGLTLVKSLVQMHGGSVSASSDGPGRGSCFTVLLPQIALPQAMLAEEGDTPAAMAGTSLPSGEIRAGRASTA